MFLPRVALHVLQSLIFFDISCEMCPCVHSLLSPWHFLCIFRRNRAWELVVLPPPYRDWMVCVVNFATRGAYFWLDHFRTPPTFLHDLIRFDWISSLQNFLISFLFCDKVSAHFILVSLQIACSCKLIADWMSYGHFITTLVNQRRFASWIHRVAIIVIVLWYPSYHCLSVTEISVKNITIKSENYEKQKKVRVQPSCFYWSCQIGTINPALKIYSNTQLQQVQSPCTTPPLQRKHLRHFNQISMTKPLKHIWSPF